MYNPGMNTDLQPYLSAGTHVDAGHPLVAATARRLAEGARSDADIVRACFEYVRDEIRHSSDFRCNPVTVRASDVLHHGTGFCYAKSHLLAAVLRANGIPAGLCYQRLATGDAAVPYCLHGLNAVWLEGHGWYRLDPRGNKPGLEARFDPPREVLPFSPDGEGEGDLPGIWAEPLPVVVASLEACSTYDQVLAALPDTALPA
jgi:transglutaminase-like putative cysteine protease